MPIDTQSTSTTSFYPSPYKANASNLAMDSSKLMDITPSKAFASLYPSPAGPSSAYPSPAGPRSDMRAATTSDINLGTMQALPSLENTQATLETATSNCDQLAHNLETDGYCSVELSQTELSELSAYFSATQQEPTDSVMSTSVMAITKLDSAPIAKTLTKLANSIHFAAKKLNKSIINQKPLKPQSLEIKQWKAHQGPTSFHNDKQSNALVMCLTIEGEKTTEFISKQQSHDLILSGNKIFSPDGSDSLEARAQHAKPNEIMIFRGAQPDNEDISRPSALVHRSPPNCEERTIGLFRFTHESSAWNGY